MDEIVVASASLVFGRHILPGRTKHLSGGIDMSGRILLLQICRYDGNSGYYLFYIDQNGNVLNDTYHASLQEAQEQAAFEFNLTAEEWTLA